MLNKTFSNLIDRIRLLFRKDKESYVCFYRMLGFYPHDIRYYEQALLHRSSSVKSDQGRLLNNERLEFFDDELSGFAIQKSFYLLDPLVFRDEQVQNLIYVFLGRLFFCLKGKKLQQASFISNIF